MSVAVILPTYCEAENIEELIREIQALKHSLIITVIDDSSPDGTAAIIQKLQAEYPNLHLVSRPEKCGLGTAITRGFRHLFKLSDVPKFIVTMDADYSHNPKDIPRLVDAAKKGNGLVIGSRYVPDGKTIGSRLGRRIISRLANIVAALTIGVKLHDYTSGFRCYSKQYVENVLPSLHSQTYEIQIETIRQAQKNRFRVKEIPIVFVDRKKGKSKLTNSEVKGFLSYIIKVLVGNAFSLMKSRKP